MMYTKEMIFNEFKEVTKKDQKKKKEIFTNRIEYLKCLKEDMIKVPKNFSNINITPQQLQNTIDCWSAPNPRDAFYKSVFGMTYAEKKQVLRLMLIVVRYYKIDMAHLCLTINVGHHFQQVIEFLVLLTKNGIQTLYQKAKQLVFRTTKVHT